MDEKELNKINKLFESIGKELNIDLKNTKSDKDNKESKNTKDTKDTKDNKDSKDNKKTDLELLQNEFNSLIKKNNELEEAKLMAVADNQNTVKRYQNESINVRKYAGERLASEIIPSIDTFRKVLSTSPDIPEVKNYLIGFEMIINQMDQGLSNAGVVMIETKVGDDFLPEFHTAVEQIETEAVASGKICGVISNGYKLHDRVIKHASVKVAK